jgi:hypothetical protein
MQANRLGYTYDWALETWLEPSITVPSGAAEPKLVPFVFNALPDTPHMLRVGDGLGVNGNPVFIPAGAKNPEGVAKVIDFWVTKDYAFLSENGIEGYTYHYDNNGVVIKETPNANNAGLDMELISANLPGLWTNGTLLPRYIMRDNVVEIKSAEAVGHIEKAKFSESVYDDKTYYMKGGTEQQAFPMPRELERIAVIRPDLETYSTELLASLIMGEKSLNNWNSYMADLKRLGLDELISIYQTRLNRAK